ncbi:complex I assembly factor TIMMDC1, mitochondrial-like [Halichondria panicea]|uniref:complex I assembly factor TIMMDC1, mitochondrial-like n=1 Tax=Halichondria panicea TaxID=6063 RepID=UPI00312BBB11
MADGKKKETQPGSPDETGLDRIKALLPGDDLAPELKELSLTIFIASVAGFLFGGMIGARHSGDKFITHNHASKFTSVMQAQRQLHAASLLGFMRKGSHWSWRVGLFAGLFSGTTLLLSEYRDKQDSLNYISAGALTGGVFRVARGLKPFIGGTVLGTLISVPVGMAMTGVERMLMSGVERDKQRQRKLEARRKYRDKWDHKLGATSALIQDMADEPSSGIQGYYKLDPSNSSSTGDSSRLDNNSSQSCDKT